MAAKGGLVNGDGHRGWSGKWGSLVSLAMATEGGLYYCALHVSTFVFEKLYEC